MKALLLFLCINSRWWPIHAFGKNYLTFQCSIIYDDNIFRYSDSDLSRFDMGKYPERFPFSTADDLILRLTATFHHPGNLGYSLRLRQYNFLRNPEKDYLYLGLSLRVRPLYLKLSYIPRYLLRYYPDIDLPSREYKACRYSYNSLKLGFELPILPNFSVDLIGSLFGYHYSPSFTEYSNRGFSGEFLLRYKGGKVNISLGGFYERSIAKATDEPGEVPETSDDPDISYWRWGARITARRKIGSLVLSLSYRYRFRDFIERKQIDLPVDSLHWGRTDRDHRVIIQFSYPFNKRISIYLKGLYELRNVKSPYWEEIYEIKDYKRRVLYLGLNSLL